VAEPARERSDIGPPQSGRASEDAAEAEAYIRAHGRCVSRGRTGDRADAETPGAHETHATARAGSVPGRIPPAVVQHIIRQEYGKLRACYDEGLRRNPTLKGALAVRFEIDRDGNASNVSRDAATDLPDVAAVQCMLRVFSGLCFAPPDEGIVTVVYPVQFSPD
jgi:hypothetical protein